MKKNCCIYINVYCTWNAPKKYQLYSICIFAQWLLGMKSDLLYSSTFPPDIFHVTLSCTRRSSLLGLWCATCIHCIALFEVNRVDTCKSNTCNSFWRIFWFYPYVMGDISKVKFLQVCVIAIHTVQMVCDIAPTWAILSTCTICHSLAHHIANCKTTFNMHWILLGIQRSID